MNKMFLISIIVFLLSFIIYLSFGLIGFSNFYTAGLISLMSAGGAIVSLFSKGWYVAVLGVVLNVALFLFIVGSYIATDISNLM